MDNEYEQYRKYEETIEKRKRSQEKYQKKMPAIAVRFDVETYQRIKEQAKLNNENISTYLRRVIKEKTDNKEEIKRLKKDNELLNKILKEHLSVLDKYTDRSSRVIELLKAKLVKT